MRLRIAVVSLLCVVLLGAFAFSGVYHIRGVKAQSGYTYNHLYLSGALFAQTGEIFTINAWNPGSSNQAAEVKIWQCTGFPCTLLYDSQFYPIPPNTRGIFQYSVAGGVTDFFTVEISTSSADVVPRLDIGTSNPPRFTMGGSEFIIRKNQF